MEASGTETIATDTPGRYEIRYKAEDSVGQTAETVRTVIVVDFTPPLVYLNGDSALTVSCVEIYEEPGATALDACDGVLPVTIREITGELNYSLIMYTAVDSAGNSGSAARLVFYEDKTPPVITLEGEEELFAECGADFRDPGAVAVDDCDGEVTVVYRGDLRLNEVGRYERTYYAEDSAGNRAERKRTFIVEDTHPPVLTLHGDPVVRLSCGERFIDPGAVAVDSCDGAVRVIVEGDLRTHTPGTYVITYTARDRAGHVAEAVRAVEVVCDTPPTIILHGDAETTLACGASFMDPGATARDYRGRELEIVVAGEVDTDADGVYVLVYTAVDAWGNAASVQRIVTVVCDAPGTGCWHDCFGRCCEDKDRGKQLYQLLGDWLLIGMLLLMMTGGAK